MTVLRYQPPATRRRTTPVAPPRASSSSTAERTKRIESELSAPGSLVGAFIGGAKGIKGLGKAVTEAPKQLPVVKEVFESTESVGKFIGHLTELKTWVRVGKVILGGVLILLGGWMLLKAIAPGAASAIATPAKVARTAAFPEATAARLGARAGSGARQVARTAKTKAKARYAARKAR
jgi:hypothetical protein